MPLVVGIPVHPPHFSLLKDALQSTAGQTRKPDRVIIAASSCVEAPKVDDTRGFPFPVHVLATPDRLNAGQNRNRIMDHLAAEDDAIISFIDADDLMLPQRLETIYATMRSNPQVDAVYHEASLGEHLGPNGSVPLSELVAGHVTVRSRVRERFPITDTCEDRDFLHSLQSHPGPPRVVCLPIKLSLYRRHLSSHDMGLSHQRDQVITR